MLSPQVNERMNEPLPYLALFNPAVHLISSIDPCLPWTLMYTKAQKVVQRTQQTGGEEHSRYQHLEDTSALGGNHDVYLTI